MNTRQQPKPVRLAARCEEMFLRQSRTAGERRRRMREQTGFMLMTRKLDREQRELKHEKYVTAMIGVKTSWPKIREHAIRFG